MSRDSMVMTPRGESEIWILRDQVRLNDPFGDLCRPATTNVPQVRTNAASAKCEKSMTVLSRTADLSA